MESERVVGRPRLSDCFLELLAYTSLLKATCARKQPSLGEVKESVRDLLNRSAQNMRALSIDPRDYDDARFAVCAWVDETILNMPWTHREEWLKSLLQSELYGTTKAGEEFFDRLNRLRPDQVDAREVYYLCLCLGFIGRYCMDGDEFLLEQLRKSTLRLLVSGPQEVRPYANEPLFGGVPAGSPDAAPPRARPWRGARLWMTAIPAAAVLAAFLVYRFVLNGVVDSFVGRITGS